MVILLNGGYMKYFFHSFLLVSILATGPAQAINLPAIPWKTVEQKGKILADRLSSLFSYQNQATMIKAYRTAEVLIHLPLMFEMLSAKSELLQPLPEEITTALEKMGMDKNSVNFYKSPIRCVGAASALGNVTIDPEFYDKANRDERLMVIGHELTHIRNHHHLQSIALSCLLPYIANAVSVGGCDALDAGFKQAEQSKFLQKYPKVLGTLQKVKDASKVTLQSPFFTFFFVEGLKAFHSRMLEKEADIVSAQTLGCSNSGVSLFNTFIEEDKNRSWLSCLHPRYLFHTLEEKIGLARHPECAERVKYLSELAKIQETIPATVA